MNKRLRGKGRILRRVSGITSLLIADYVDSERVCVFDCRTACRPAHLPSASGGFLHYPGLVLDLLHVFIQL